MKTRTFVCSSSGEVYPSNCTEYWVGCGGCNGQAGAGAAESVTIARDHCTVLTHCHCIITCTFNADFPSRFESFSLFTRNIKISLFVCRDKTMDVLTPRKWSSNGHQYLKLVVAVGNSLNSHFHPSQSGPAQLGSDLNTYLNPGLAWCCVCSSEPVTVFCNLIYQCSGVNH